MTSTTSPTAGVAHQRSTVKAVALPAEHGGWGLTAEPVLLGLLIAPSWAGLALGAAAMTAFVARTPIKIGLGDLRRGRRLDRTRVALAIGAAELVLLGALVTTAVLLADQPFWMPLLVAGPLLVTELAFDIRSRGRRLVPELAGSIGVASVAAMIVLADGHDLVPAIGVWTVLAARAVTSIPHVRDQIRRLHGRPTSTTGPLVADAGAVLLVAAAAAAVPELVGGAIAIIAVAIAQRIGALRPAPSAIVVGIRQSILGVAVVLCTWLGVVLSGGLL
jgi:hypothetical protein